MIELNLVPHNRLWTGLCFNSQSLTSDLGSSSFQHKECWAWWHHLWLGFTKCQKSRQKADPERKLFIIVTETHARKEVDKCTWLSGKVKSKHHHNAAHPRASMPPILDETELKAVEEEGKNGILCGIHHKIHVFKSEFYPKYTLPLFS